MVIGSIRQSVKVDPVSRQPVSETPCSAARSNVQEVNELDWWALPYSSVPTNRQRSNVTRRVRTSTSEASVKSQSMNEISSSAWPARSTSAKSSST